MSEHDLEKLLGGFAADTLTPEEKKALYATALQHQQLFNALADEQALKELLADPDVRRRLLASLEQKGSSGAGGSLAWLDWFRRPAGLAFAGGLTAAALAVVLGIRIYQDSLKQAAQSVATEEMKPSAPPNPMPPALQPAPPQVAEPQARVKENIAPAIDLAKKDALVDKPTKRERSAPPPSKEERASDAASQDLKQQSEHEEVRGQAETPVDAFSKTAEEVAGKKLAKTSAPPAASAPGPVQAPANAPLAGALSPALSARTLFYAGDATRQDTGTTAPEKERAMKPLAESAPQANRLERKMDQSARAGKAAGTAAQLKPLGLRYGFVVRGTDGQDREVDAATASKRTDPVHLTVEANQDAYLQIWKTVGSSTPQLLLPEKDTGQISLKIAAGQRRNIPLSTGSEPVTLTVRLSRVPFGPITRQEAAMFDRPSPNQLQEFITTGGLTDSQEQATYVVNQDPASTAQISVEIPLSR